MKYYHLSIEETLELNAINLSKTSGYFRLSPNLINIEENTLHKRNMYAEGSFKDPSLYRFLNKITREVYVMTMRDMAAYSLKRQWHKGSWCGTQLVKRVGSQRSILQYLGKVA